MTTLVRLAKRAAGSGIDDFRRTADGAADQAAGQQRAHQHQGQHGGTQRHHRAAGQVLEAAFVACQEPYLIS